MAAPPTITVSLFIVAAQEAPLKTKAEKIKVGRNGFIFTSLIAFTGRARLPLSVNTNERGERMQKILIFFELSGSGLCPSFYAWSEAVNPACVMR